MNRSDLTRNLLKITFASGTIGIALKFLTFQIRLNQQLHNGNILNDLWFPYFPNMLDSAFLIISVIGLIILGRTKK